MKEKAKIVLQIALMSFPLVSLAQLTPGTPVQGPGELWGLLCNISGWIYTFTVTLSVIFILYAAYTYLTSQGDENKVKTATNMITYIVVGIAVALVAYGVPMIVNELVGGGGDVNVCP